MLVSREAHCVARPTQIHLAPHELEAFLRGDLDRAGCRRVVRHLLTGCRECRAIAQTLWNFGERARIPRLRLLQGGRR
jgi:hypothetical protein